MLLKRIMFRILYTSTEFPFANLNDIIVTLLFPEQLKYADIRPLRKTLEMLKEIIEQLVFSLTFLKYMKYFYTNN